MPLVLFALGLGIGVCLNALADALPPDQLGQSHTPGRPRCHYCGAEHAPLYWLALGSFILRRGRCEHCGAPRRLRHGIVELVTGICLAGLWSWAGGQWFPFFCGAVLAVIFILITVIDIEHRLILWRVVFPAAIIVGVMQAINHGWQKTLWGGLAGYGIVLGMYLVGLGFSFVMARRRGQPLEEVAFGGGDVNLAGLVGLAVGWPEMLLVLVVTIFSGGLVALAILAVQSVRRRYTPYTAFPYGPFFVLGATVIYLFGKEFAAWYLARPAP
jgi:leader peptidase (prepilin peptidase)/N-methyltransferase